jgi:hypothetical protein
VGNICGLWSNLLGSLSETVSPQSGSRRSTTRSSRSGNQDSGTASSGFGCEGAEFRISCGPSRSEADDADERDSESERETPTRARYASGKREIDVTT